MKAVFALAAVAAMAGSAAAANVHHRHAHDLFHGLEKKGNDSGVCVPGCSTIWTTVYGEATLYIPPAPTTTYVKTTSAPAVTSTSVAVVVPTPIAQTCPTPGVYTFPATTVTLTETTTVCAASTTKVPSGTHTLGGVTTVVTTATTVVCPYATVSTSGSVTTSVIKTTTYVCPSAGTYTIAPTTTVCETETVVVVPVVTTYCPGTYTQPAVVTTIVETNTVVYCPFSIPTTSAAPPPPATTTATYAPVKATSSASPKPTGASGSGAGVTPGWGIAYTPYLETYPSGCKTAEQVMADLTIIAAAGIKTVRVYSTDCDTLPNVGAACEALGLKMIVGIFVDTPGCQASNPSIQDQISSLASWAKWDLVELFVVGNEAIFNGFCTAEEIVSLIGQVKSACSGYTGPYTTTETLSVWQQGSSVTGPLCEAIDVVGGNLYAFFNQQTTCDQAGTFVAGQLELLNGICEGKSGKICETGWPSAGGDIGDAVAGTSEQLIAITNIVKEVSGGILLGFSDDAWKGGATYEQHWGLKSILSSL